MKKKLSILALYFVFLINMSVHADSVVLIWNQEILDLIAETKFPGTIASRAFAMTHTSMFDAWAAYDNRAIGTRRGDTLRRPEAEHTEANKRQAISFAAFRTLVNLFPQHVDELTQLMNALGYDASDASTDLSTPTGIGNTAAFDIIHFRLFDGANQTGTEPGSNGLPYSDYTGFVPVNTPFVINDPNQWQPLLVNHVVQQAVTPQWFLVLPFSLSSPNEFSPDRTPATYPSSRYTHQAERILELSAGLNDCEKTIAEFWAGKPGETTPGTWNTFAQFVSRRDSQTLDDDTKMFFALNNGLLDASIALWYYKFFYVSERPITAIHFLFNGKKVKAWGGPGQGTQIIEGQTWQPYVATPAFPEFVSGHSTFSAAAAEVLKLFTRSDIFDYAVLIPKGSSLIEPGLVPATDIVLCWKTFKEAADQAGYSRRLGGVHFKDGDLGGRRLGKQVGVNAFARAQHFIKGTI